MKNVYFEEERKTSYKRLSRDEDGINGTYLAGAIGLATAFAALGGFIGIYVKRLLDERKERKKIRKQKEMERMEEFGKYIGEIQIEKTGRCKGVFQNRRL